MKKINIKDIIVPTIALFIFCLVATALLAGTNMITKDKIADNAVQTEIQSRKLVLPEGVTYSDAVEADDGVTYCTGYDSEGNEVGYVFTAGAKGYGGTVTVMAGIDTEGKITGVEILSHSETPGLGANAVKPDFKNRFIGKSGILTVDKNSNEGQNVQAITAATITSKAVTNAVNLITEAYNQITGGENNG
ncbi:MAG: RnfABCDGE type electron transport complex subunit G [Clostridia bacterium]|nr:RnfABCDGE type electron transport complex subunit G [Clostridia bacterium]